MEDQTAQVIVTLNKPIFGSTPLDGGEPMEATFIASTRIENQEDIIILYDSIGTKVASIPKTNILGVIYKY